MIPPPQPPFTPFFPQKNQNYFDRFEDEELRFFILG